MKNLLMLRRWASNLLIIAAITTVDFANYRTYAAAPSQNSAKESSPVTWSGQIAQLIYKNCTTCHHTGGGAPFSLLTYHDAQRWGSQIARVTQSRYMPPWLPEHGYGDFVDERSLTSEEIAQIAKWVKSGMIEGNPALAPPVPKYSETWQYGKPDLILTTERPFNLVASGTDVFRNFVLPYPLQQTHYIRAMEIHPGVPQIVHHANVLVDRTASFRRQHPEQWKDSVPGMELEVDAGNDFDPDSHFLFWKPDSPILIEPEDMPWRLDPGNDLILNMHLKPSGKPELVSSQIGLYFTNTPPSKQPMLLQLEHDSAIDIPPNKPDFIVEDSLQIPIDIDILGIYPHAHYLGKRLESWAILPDGQKKWLILIPNWDIDRQSVYRYRNPVFLPKNSTVHMRYIYDNSAENIHNPHLPPIRVKAGNRSEDEMAHLWLQVLPVHTNPNGPDPRYLLEEAWMRSRLKKVPDDTIALYNLASALIGQQRYIDAAAAYQQMLTLSPGNERALIGLGVVQDSTGNWQQAQNTYTQAIAFHPEACNARFDLAQLDLKHDQVNVAEQQLHIMLAQCPPDAGTHSALGVALAKENKFEAAQAEFHKALEISPDDFTALYNLGDMALQINQPQQAISYLMNAAKERPSDMDTHEQLANAYAQSGQFGEAVQQLRNAIKLMPDNPDLHALLSQTLAATGQLQEAILEQKAALHLRVSDADGWNNLGVLEAQAGKTTEAREDFQHALQIAPDHSEARANLNRLPPS
jgi:Flp pilus assembly protein TadD/mono/diheme cytochrome c family protein